jgi:3-isopropylmalate dehydrogenase
MNGAKLDKIFKPKSIAVIGGDGTGPEVIAEGLKVLKAASSKFGFSYDTTMFDYGGERYLKTGKTITDEEITDSRNHPVLNCSGVACSTRSKKPKVA